MHTNRYFTFTTLRSLWCKRAVAAMISTVAALSAHGAGETDNRFKLPQGRYAFTIEGSVSNEARAIALQPNGHIVMVGTCGSGNGFDNDFCVARLNEDGDLDGNFVGPSGTAAGSFLLPIGIVSDVGTAVAVQPDGKIILAGSCNGPGNDDFCLARLHPNGSLDVTFNGPSAADGGEGAGQGKFLLKVGNGHDTLAAMALQPDGKIVLVGSCADGGKRSFCIARLLSNGALDHSFVNVFMGSSGKFTFRFANTTQSEDATALAIQPDGKIVIAGQCTGTTTALDFCMARLHSNGSFDEAFDGGGSVLTGRITVPVSPGARNDLVTAIAIGPNGNIVLAGACHNGSKYVFCAARLGGGERNKG